MVKSVKLTIFDLFVKYCQILKNFVIMAKFFQYFGFDKIGVFLNTVKEAGGLKGAYLKAFR